MRSYQVLAEFDFTPDGLDEPRHVEVGGDPLTSDDLSDARAEFFISLGLLAEVTE